MAYTEETYDRLKTFMQNYKIPATLKHPIGIYYKPATDKDLEHQDYYCFAMFDQQEFDQKSHEYVSRIHSCREFAVDLITGDDVTITQNNYSQYHGYYHHQLILDLTDRHGDASHERLDRYFLDVRSDIGIIGQVSINADDVVLHEPINWHLSAALLIDKDKHLYAWDGDHEWIVSLEHTGLGQVASVAFPGPDGSSRYSISLKDFNTDLDLDWSKFNKIFPSVYYPKTGQPQTVTTSFHNLLDYLYWTPPKSSRATKKILNIVSKPVPDLIYDLTHMVGSREHQLVVQKVEDGMCVMRFMEVEHLSDSETYATEEFRIYVTKDDAVSCGRLGNSWGKKNLKTSIQNWEYRLIPFDKDIVKNTKLAYFYDILQNVDAKSQGLLLWACMVEPLVEQLAKLGFVPFLVKILEHATYGRISLTHMLEEYFGFIEKKGNPAKRLGLSNRQLKILADLLINTETCSHVLARIKLVLSDRADQFTNYDFGNQAAWTDLSSLDDQTFKELLACFNDTESTSYPRYYVAIMAGIKSVYGASKMLKTMRLIFDCFYGHQITNVYLFSRNYTDYLNMVKSLREIGFRTLPCEIDAEHPEESIQEMHDAAADLYNLQQDELKQAQFDEASQRAAKWAYDDPDENYLIIVPTKADDLVHEGSVLHHCVGSYVDRVCSGTTNILFLRCRTAMDQPYYTVEVTNDNTIQQIHGACNHNLDVNSPEEKFVKKWAKERRLKLGSYNQVR